MRTTSRLLSPLLAGALLMAGLAPDTEGASESRSGGKAPSSTSSVSTNKANASKGKSSKGKSSKKSRRAKPAPRNSPAELVNSLPRVPVESPEALEPFFDSLRGLARPSTEPQAAPRITRILHFGDSHVAADYWTGELRALLQARFGDAGPGLVMPGKPWKFFRHARAKSLGGKGWARCGLRDDPCAGPTGLFRVGLRPVALPTRMEPAILEAEFRTAEIQYAVGNEWDRTVTIDGTTLMKPPPPTLEEDYETNPEPEAPTTEPAESPDPHSLPQEGFSTDLGEMDYFLFAEWNREPLAPGLHRIEVDLSGDALLLGIDLRSGDSGILYDALGINGTEMADLDAWEPGVRADLLLHASPALIVVSFGTNDMGAKGFDAETYFAACLGVLQRLRADAPDVPVLVTGPAERGGKHRRVRARMLERSGVCSDALRRAALDAGCAFWDARAAMGGRGSIARWAAAGLAQADQVHLTESGYKTLARLLFDALVVAYDKGPPMTEVPLLPAEPPPP